MSFSASDLNTIFWIVALVVAFMIVFGVIRFFFRHLMRFFFHGCGFVFFLIIVLLVLHYLKIF